MLKLSRPIFFFHPEQLPVNLNRGFPFQVLDNHRNTELRWNTQHHVDRVGHWVVLNV